MPNFFFHPAKTVTTGEGGAILTNGNNLADKLQTLRTHGMVRNKSLNLIQENAGDEPWYYEMATLGYNYRITDFQFALGLSLYPAMTEAQVQRVIEAILENLQPSETKTHKGCK